MAGPGGFDRLLASPSASGYRDPMATWRMLTAVVLAAGLGCAKASDDAAARRTPAVPPPGEVAIPRTLRLPVSIDGRDAGVIDAERLGAVPPAFADEERRAWKVAQVIPEAAAADAVVEARSASGVSMRMDRPPDGRHLEPVLFLTRRGDVVVSLVDPTEPFPEYHGQGGRLRRQGDPLPRLAQVTALAIVRAR